MYLDEVIYYRPGGSIHLSGGIILTTVISILELLLVQIVPVSSIIITVLVLWVLQRIVRIVVHDLTVPVVELVRGPAPAKQQPGGKS